MLPYSKKHCADVIKLEIIEKPKLPCIIDGPNVVTRVLIRRNREGQGQREDVVMEAEVVTVHFESGGRMQAISRSWERQRRGASP